MQKWFILTSLLCVSLLKGAASDKRKAPEPEQKKTELSASPSLMSAPIPTPPRSIPGSLASALQVHDDSDEEVVSATSFFEKWHGLRDSNDFRK